MSEAYSIKSINLPVLKDTRYHGVPRRYEETRPVVIQGYAHRKILGIGHELHRRSIEFADHEKQAKIRQAEQAVWDEAEQIKAIALQRAREEAAIEQEKVVNKLNKAHEKALKEEALRVEMAMQKLAIEQVKQERVEAEERLREAVRKTEERCHQELVDAVDAARKEEIKKSTDKAAKVKKERDEEYDSAVKAAAQDKAKHMKTLREAKDKERVRQVQETEAREKKAASDAIAKLTKEYEDQIYCFQVEIIEMKSQIEEHVRTITNLDSAKQNVETCLLETRVEFQKFINQMKLFQGEDADYLIPPCYLDEITDGDLV